MEVELGTKVKDKLTGFKGVATARCEYLSGCVRYEITPAQLKDGIPQEEYWLDEQRVIPIGRTTKKETSEEPPGGPGNHPTKRNPPSLGGY